LKAEAAGVRTGSARLTVFMRDSVLTGFTTGRSHGRKAGGRNG
jgi:hypothetical protein